MYEIVELKNNYLEECNGVSKIYLDFACLSADTLKKLNGETDIESDVIDVEISPSVKRADKIDMGAAVTIGFTAYLVDYFFRINKLGDKLVSNFNTKDYINFVINNCSIKKYDGIEKDIEKQVDEIENEIKNADDYRKMVFDFSKELSFNGLFVQIIEYCSDLSIGMDEWGKIVILKDEKELNCKDTLSKAYYAMIDWLIDQAYEYKKNSEYKKEINKVLKHKKEFSKVKKLIKKIYEVAFKNNEFNASELKKWFHKQLDKDKIETDIGNLTAQNLAVQMEILLVRVYIHVKNFIEQINEHHVKTLEGLKIIDFERIDNERIISRMDTISAAILSTLNIGVVVFSSVKDNNLDGHILDINIPNLLRLKVLIENDFVYLKEDINEYLHKAKVVEVVKHKDVPLEQLEKCLTLNKAQTKILYSLQLHLINEDIQETKSNAEQQLKNEWKEKWIEVTESSINQKKIFEENPKKTYQLLLTYAGNDLNNLLWLYNIALELSIFRPYFNIDLEKENKYKKLKPVKTDYLKKYFCQLQEYITYEDVKNIRKAYSSYCGYLDNRVAKIAGGAAGVVALAAAGGGVAFAFAPQIAVALFGGAFPALHGAALVNAALAAAGGGAIAAGGAGMAGGALVIAGGGAVIGLGASSTALGILSSPSFVQNDYAKLLVKCDEIFIKKMNMIDEVISLQHKVENDLSDYKLQLEMLESLDNPTKECKTTINGLKKSIAYSEKANKKLLDLTKDK